MRTLSLAQDGSIAVGTDTYAGYVYDSSAPNPGNAGGTGTFKLIITPSSIPSSDPTTSLGALQNWTGSGSGGVYELQFAPSNSQILYMNYQGYMFKSTNKGTTWTNLSGWTVVTQSDANPNVPPQSAGSQEFGPRLAVHPSNPNIVFIGLQTNGALKTTDGGTTWTAISSASIANQSGGSGIFFCFDPNTPANMFAFSYATGAYKSTDTGSTWTKISGTGTSNTTLTTCSRIKVDPLGNLWCIDNSGNAANVWKYNGTTWTNPTTLFGGFTPNSGSPYHDVAFDPTVSSPLRILLVDQQMYLTQSIDGGTTWFGSSNATGGGPFGIPVLTATDIPYLGANLGSAKPITGAMDFLPGTSTLIISTGVGVYTITPASVVTSATTWASKSTSIEQLVTNLAAYPPGGPLFVSAYDRPFFALNLSVYPSTYQPGNFVATPGGTGLDYAKTDPTFIVGVQQGGVLQKYSSGTWQASGTLPGTVGGSIAAFDTTHYVAALYSGSPQVTSNGGGAWTDLGTAFPLVPAGTGWTAAGFNSDDRVVVAESSTIGYIYNNNSDVNGGGIYKTADAGSTWNRQSGRTGTGIPTPTVGGKFKMFCVPSHAGHIVWCGGETFQGGGPGGTNLHPYTAASNLYMSTDGGVTMTDLSANVRDVWGFGIGKQVGSYPRFVIWGYVNVASVWTSGVWYSDDQGSSWFKIGELTTYGTYDLPKWLEVNKDNNEVYIGFYGSGWARYG